MNHIGQIISLIVAVLWTVTAIYSDKASHRIGSMSANVFRLTLSTFLLALILWVTIGHPYLIMSLFGPVVGVSLSLMAVRYTDAGIASTLMALTPVLILFPAAVFDKQRIRIKEIVGVLVSMTGVALFFLL